jgi:Secretion system C-terminal sorting domain
MKVSLLILILLYASLSFPQQRYYTFSELNGLDDSSGNTHLFYRLYYNYNKNNIYRSENSIYHLDLYNNTDSLFLFDGGGWAGIGDPSFTSIIDYEFWDKDPSKFIYSGVSTVVDPVPFIKRFDEDNFSLYSLGEAANGNIEISKQNDSLIFAGITGILFKSSDGGRNWDTLNSTFGKQLISLSPFNDSVLFVQENNHLIKSTDRGLTFTTVDTFTTDFKSFLYDKDGKHIYRISNAYGENSLQVSDNNGEAYSWTKRFSSESEMYVTLDYSRLGAIYLSNGRNIYVSNDYGESFDLYKTLERKIVGIYKKPNSDIIYAATKYELYEIRSDSTIILKHLEIDPDILNLFPLKIGNEWSYEHYIEMYKSDSKVRVESDTLINNKLYFKLKNFTLKSISYDYYRIDSVNCKIFIFLSDSDFTYYDFSANDVGDTVLFDSNNGYIAGWYLEDKSSFNKLGINSDSYLYNDILNASGYQLNTFVKDIGLYKEEGGEVLYSLSVLKGFVKDGIVYGDTTLVGINDGKNNIPAEFPLSQNYPNPFNPTTKINFQIEKSGLVSLKVYDILGREVASIINEEKHIGEYEIKFDASKYNLPSGVYFYKLQAGSYIQTKKMILLK